MITIETVNVTLFGNDNTLSLAQWPGLLVAHDGLTEDQRGMIRTTIIQTFFTPSIAVATDFSAVRLPKVIGVQENFLVPKKEAIEAAKTGVSLHVQFAGVVASFDDPQTMSQHFKRQVHILSIRDSSASPGDIKNLEDFE